MAVLPFEPHATTPQRAWPMPRPVDVAPRGSDATIAGGLEAAVTREMRLEFAVDALRTADPEASASRRLVRWQALSIAGSLIALAAGLTYDPRGTIALVFVVGAFPALAYLALRLAAIREVIEAAGNAGCPPAIVSWPDLPVYSVLVPLYREAPVVGQLLAALEGLDYPRDRLDVLLIVEEDDTATIAAIAEADLPPNMRVIVVPEGQPRTKPRALNYALTYARGTFVAVFDAEDQPEPDQLVKAVAAFRDADAGVGCLQAHLNIYNPASSWLTSGIA